MKLKLFLLSPVTSLYNYQLNMGTLRMREEINRVTKMQIGLLPIGLILGAPLTALLSISNLLYIIILMYNHHEIQEEPVKKMKDYFNGKISNNRFGSIKGKNDK